MTELTVGSKVFYPSHGAGWISDSRTIEFDGQKKKYFEFKLINDSISISTPVDKMEELKVREVLPTDKIEKSIKVLKKNPGVDPEVSDFNVLLNIFKKIEESSDIEDSVKAIQYCNFVREKREKEGRLIPISIETTTNDSIRNIVSELAVSSDKTLEEASKRFTKLTGIEVKEKSIS